MVYVLTRSDCYNLRGVYLAETHLLWGCWKESVMRSSVVSHWNRFRCHFHLFCWWTRHIHRRISAWIRLPDFSLGHLAINWYLFERRPIAISCVLKITATDRPMDRPINGSTKRFLESRAREFNNNWESIKTIFFIVVIFLACFADGRVKGQAH